MLAAAALLLAGTQGAPADRVLLEAFEGPCQHVEDFAKMKAAAPGAGWEAIEETAAPRVAALLDKGRKALESDETMTGATFQRSHQGRPVYLILSRAEMKGGMWGNGCRVYDFDAPAPLDIAAAEAWIGKEPTGVQDLGGGLIKHLWEPWVSGRSFELNYMPASHPVAQAWGLSGVVLVSSAIGGF
ncbi:MAG: hypothetical protein V4574_16365 [Pseudomonadota bacterium]